MKILSPLLQLLVPKRLSVQLGLLFSAFLAVSLLIYTYHSVEEQAERLVFSLQNDARVLVDNIAATAADYVLDREYAAIERVALRSARFPSVMAIQIADATGKLLTDVRVEPGMEPQVRYGQLRIVPPNTQQQLVQYTELAMVVWQPLILGEVVGWVRATYDLTAIEKAKDEYWAHNIVDGIIVVVIAVGLLNIIMQAPIRQIRRYTRFSHQLVENPGEQIPVNIRSEELAQLGGALNTASTRLKEQSLEIQRAVHELERLAAFAENTPNFVVSINSAGQIVYINPRGRVILQALSLTVESIVKVLPNDIDRLIESCIKQQRVLQELEVEYSGVVLLWTFAPVKGQDLIHGYGVDITRRKQAEASVQQAYVEKMAAIEASRAKSQFLATMSHELRTPLNAILGYADLLVEEAAIDSPPQSVASLKKIHSAGSHLLHLIDEILDLSKIESGKMEVYIEEIDLRDTIEDVLATVQTLADKNGNRIIARYSSSLKTIHSDAKKLRQILLNLLSNACKFTRDGTIEVETKTTTQGDMSCVDVIVKDNGIGMTEEQMSRVFDNFSQADSSTTRKYGGTGLGLTISKRLSQLLGGDITVQSQPGKGASFTLRIPLDSSSYGIKFD